MKRFRLGSAEPTVSKEPSREPRNKHGTERKVEGTRSKKRRRKKVTLNAARVKHKASRSKEAVGRTHIRRV